MKTLTRRYFEWFLDIWHWHTQARMFISFDFWLSIYTLCFWVLCLPVVPLLLLIDWNRKEIAEAKFHENRYREMVMDAEWRAEDVGKQLAAAQQEIRRLTSLKMPAENSQTVISYYQSVCDQIAQMPGIEEDTKRALTNQKLEEMNAKLAQL